MTTHERAYALPGRQLPSASRFGFWAAMATGVTTLFTFAVAICTPPMSGELCKEGCFGYPYLEIASRFPRDYYWMFSSILATLLYVAFMLGIQARATPEKRLFAQFGLIVSAMAALTIIGDYFVQLAVIQPSVLAGEADGVSMLSQYNPHGIFIALEELGYLLMSLSLACAAAALSSATRLERSVRWLFGGSFVVCVLTLGWFLVKYGHQRGYLFEIAVISIVWLTLIPGAFMMAAVFRRDLVAGSADGNLRSALAEKSR